MNSTEEQKQDHPRQDIIEFLCGAGTYDSLWWNDIPKDKRPTYWWRSKLRDHNTDLLAKVSELQGDLRSKSDSYDECWQDYTAERARANHAVEKMNEAKAKVSEQEKEIAELTKEVNDLHLLPAYVVARRSVDAEIKALTEQVEKLKGDNVRLDMLTKDQESEIEHSDDEKDKYRETINRLREREKELVEALRARYEHLKWLKDVNTTPPSVIDEINFLQSLLSKFEVPNT